MKLLEIKSVKVVKAVGGVRLLGKVSYEERFYKKA
jgi:hypothetical protein